MQALDVVILVQCVMAILLENATLWRCTILQKSLLPSYPFPFDRRFDNTYKSHAGAGAERNKPI